MTQAERHSWGAATVSFEIESAGGRRALRCARPACRSPSRSATAALYKRSYITSYWGLARNELQASTPRPASRPEGYAVGQPEKMADPPKGGLEVELREREARRRPTQMIDVVPSAPRRPSAAPQHAQSASAAAPVLGRAADGPPAHSARRGGRGGRGRGRAAPGLLQQHGLSDGPAAPDGGRQAAAPFQGAAGAHHARQQLTGSRCASCQGRFGPRFLYSSVLYSPLACCSALSPQLHLP
jgi:hypothetical protein